MGGQETRLEGPDLARGVPLAELQEGRPLLGHAHGEPVVLIRHGKEISAVGATCTHYSGPLAEGIVVGDSIRCPWHHACFDLKTGAPSAPALNTIPCYAVGRYGATVTVGAKLPPPAAPHLRAAGSGLPATIVIVGAGAAGNAVAEKLRRIGYQGQVVLVSGDPAGPVDRPNLSKDYLAGNAPEEWIPLRAPDFYREQQVELLLGIKAEAIDAKVRQLRLADGRTLGWDQLVLATGSEPIRLSAPGADRPHVRTLRTLADSRDIIARAGTAKKAVIVGASFIGLEAAASLRARGLEVHVVAPETVPFERVFGPLVGALVMRVHEEHGVVFHLGHTVAAIGDKAVTLASKRTLDADLVVVGIGVRPAVALAEAAGARVDNGVVVDEYLETSLPGVYAIGDVARYPDPRSGRPVRIEHWVHAERMGEAVARNLVGPRRPFTAVPFFWSAHWDLTLRYVGHAPSWDEVDVDGDLPGRDCRLSYRLGGKTLAVLTIGRDRESLEAEAAMERA